MSSKLVFGAERVNPPLAVGHPSAFLINLDGGSDRPSIGRESQGTGTSASGRNEPHCHCAFTNEREEEKNEHQIQRTWGKRLFDAHGLYDRASDRGRVEQGNQGRVQHAGRSSRESTRCRKIRIQAR